MKDSISKTMSIEFSLGNEFTFKFSGSYLDFPGFKKIYKFSDNDLKEEENKKVLEGLKVGDDLNIKDIIPEQKFTQPPLGIIRPV